MYAYVSATAAANTSIVDSLSLSLGFLVVVVVVDVSVTTFYCMDDLMCGLRFAPSDCVFEC